MSKEKQMIEEMACDMCTVILNCNEPYKPMPSCEAYQCAKRAIEKGYRKQSEWISVEERLPDIDELCLLSMENRITKYRWVVIDYFHTNYDEYVTHWMPLPKPPKKGGEE